MYSYLQPTKIEEELQKREEGKVHVTNIPILEKLTTH